MRRNKDREDQVEVGRSRGPEAQGVLEAAAQTIGAALGRLAKKAGFQKPTAAKTGRNLDAKALAATKFNAKKKKAGKTHPNNPRKHKQATLTRAREQN